MARRSGPSRIGPRVEAILGLGHGLFVAVERASKRPVRYKPRRWNVGWQRYQLRMF